jgi:hypothetical protein
MGVGGRAMGSEFDLPYCTESAADIFWGLKIALSIQRHFFSKISESVS